jgi:molybdopterin/thiamine biosynthesis adenylyltransferase
MSKARRLVVVGVGALGSHVVQLLRNVDAWICVIDFDRVEQKNVGSQFHAQGTVGKKKVLGLTQSMRFLFKRELVAIPHKLTKDNVEELLGDADLVIDCLDNAESRRIVQNYCHDILPPKHIKGVTVRPIPCLHGALDGAGSFGMVRWSEDFTIDEEPADGAATCDDGEFLPFIAITAAFIAQAASTFLRTGERLSYSIHPGGAFRT